MLRISQAGGFLLWAVLLAGFPLRVAPVRGASMEPTLQDGEWLCYREVPWLVRTLHRGDLVVFKSPVRPGQRYVKRVVGLPGDQLRFADGELEVNGRPFALPASAVTPDQVLSVRVPSDCFYAVGDHGEVSFDSRVFGPVKLDRLVGQVVFSLGE